MDKSWGEWQEPTLPRSARFKLPEQKPSSVLLSHWAIVPLIHSRYLRVKKILSLAKEIFFLPLFMFFYINETRSGKKWFSIDLSHYLLYSFSLNQFRDAPFLELSLQFFLQKWIVLAKESEIFYIRESNVKNILEKMYIGKKV